MAEQSQTAADAPGETKLCKMGCGFFGNGATGDCCSKCWRELQKKKETSVPQAAPVPAPQLDAVKPIAPTEPDNDNPTPMEVDETPAVADTVVVEETKIEDKPVQSTPKKKKKTSYKSMMKGMMNKDISPDKIEKEKESLRKGLGGGAFSKIDKI